MFNKNENRWGEYFPERPNSFAVLLKGRSIELLKKYSYEFKKCFLVNNFDKEIELLGDYLREKDCVHFVNRLMTAPLTKENYKNYRIRDIQLCKTTTRWDFSLLRAKWYYKYLGLNTHMLPKRLLRFNKMFGEEYANKYPNTGVLAIIFALEILRPKNLWIFGLDFYQSDYLVRRAHQNPIEIQQAKMKRINLASVMATVFKKYKDVNINMVTYYDSFPETENVKIINQ